MFIFIYTYKYEWLFKKKIELIRLDEEYNTVM